MATHRSYIELLRNGGRASFVSGLSLLVVIAAVLYCTFSVEAGDWHQLSQIICSDCHTVHYSADGVPLTEPEAESGGPFSQLLLASTATNVCLTCHDGTQPDAPDVVNFPYPAVGGYFDNIGDTVFGNPNGHDLGMDSAQTPPGSNDSLILNCVSCHDPHGSDNYRNLLLDPLGSVSSNISLKVKQTLKADGPGGNDPDDVYVQTNILYQSGMSDWCLDCHPDFHGTTATSFRHPQDITIYQKPNADYDHWSGTITNRVRVQVDNVAVQDPTDIPSFHDRVFCLSCHRAHGSVNKSSLIYADGTGMLSTCQQCHNQ